MKIKCLLVMPNKEVQKVKIPASTKFIKAFIGDNLLKIRANENNLIIANQNAENDEFNRFFQGCIVWYFYCCFNKKQKNYINEKERYKEVLQYV